MQLGGSRTRLLLSSVVAAALAGCSADPYTGEIGTNVSGLYLGDRLLPGQTIGPNDYLLSPDGQTMLYQQGDGQLVLWQQSQALWFAGHSYSAGYTRMETDGNLVIYNASGGAMWSTATRHSGAYMRVVTGDFV